MEQLETQIAQLTTEAVNPATIQLDRLPTLDMVRLINDQNRTIADAVDAVAPAIAQAIDLIVGHMQQGGRLFYVGAGTSGRLGILDASECPPTFSVPFGRVIGLIAGGDAAIRKAVENAEDDPQLAQAQLAAYDVTHHDVVCAIAASGRTPYCMGALQAARRWGAATLCVTNNKNSKLAQYSDIAIEAEVGPEALSGSTRLKAGTAQKMVLNLLSTGAMVRMGKVYRNWMVDLTASNEKLVQRSRSMLRQILPKVTQEQAAAALQQANGSVKLAAVMLAKGVGSTQAEKLLRKSGGFLRPILEGEDKDDAGIKRTDDR